MSTNESNNPDAEQEKHSGLLATGYLEPPQHRNRYDPDPNVLDDTTYKW